MKEKRKKRIIINQEGNKITTLTTYRRFRKRLIKEGIEFYSYHKKERKYIFSDIPLKERRIKKEREVPEKRIRKQVVLNMKSYEEPYSMSVRALTINPEITENGLKLAIIETIKELNFDLNTFYRKEFGFEEREIPEQEDRRLNDYRVHIEIFIKRNPPINFIK